MRTTDPAIFARAMARAADRVLDRTPFHDEGERYHALMEGQTAAWTFATAVPTSRAGAVAKLEEAFRLHRAALGEDATATALRASCRAFRRCEPEAVTYVRRSLSGCEPGELAAAHVDAVLRWAARPRAIG